MVELLPHDLAKVTENFTGKEHDEEIKLDYFGARYLDPMLGMWISVDPARQFSSPYLYAGNGYNPVNVIDPDGEATYQIAIFLHNPNMLKANPDEGLGDDFQDFHAVERWGHSEFGDDFAIRIVRNQNEMINFVKEGEYTAIVGHTWQGEEGMLFNRTRGPSDELNLNELDEALMGSDSFAKVFGCKTGKCNVEFSQIEYGGNEGKLSIGEAYMEVARYLTEGWNTDHRLETNKSTTSDE
ncbi:MAG: RHS repeat-associated core domain-containing protein [Bacteroidales bacterium]|nr:RHS repeat-associated core domain-containing protein [Bacteroidales bacterium]